MKHISADFCFPYWMPTYVCDVLEGWHYLIWYLFITQLAFTCTRNEWKIWMISIFTWIQWWFIYFIQYVFHDPRPYSLCIVNKILYTEYALPAPEIVYYASTISSSIIYDVIWMFKQKRIIINFYDKTNPSSVTEFKIQHIIITKCFVMSIIYFIGPLMSYITYTANTLQIWISMAWGTISIFMFILFIVYVFEPYFEKIRYHIPFVNQMVTYSNAPIL